MKSLVSSVLHQQHLEPTHGATWINALKPLETDVAGRTASFAMTTMLIIVLSAFHPSAPESEMTIGALVAPLRLPFCSMRRSTSMPSSTVPNTTCLPFRCAVAVNVRKNCERFCT